MENVSKELQAFKEEVKKKIANTWIYEQSLRPRVMEEFEQMFSAMESRINASSGQQPPTQNTPQGAASGNTQTPEAPQRKVHPNAIKQLEEMKKVQEASRYRFKDL